MLLVIAALMLIKPGWITDRIGIALLAAVVVAQLPRRKSSAQPL